MLPVHVAVHVVLSPELYGVVVGHVDTHAFAAESRYVEFGHAVTHCFATVS